MAEQGLDVDVILERIEPEKVKEGAVDDTQDEVEILRTLVAKSEEDLRKMRARMETLNQKLEESQSEEDLNSERMCEIQQRLDGLQLDLELKFVQNDDESGEGESDHSSVSSSANQAKQLKEDIAKLEETLHELELCLEHYVCMVVILKELLAESRGKKQDAETERQLYQRELENAKIKVKASVEELNVLTQRLQAAQNEMLEKTESVTKLQEQMQWLETSADEVKFQVLQLQERLQDEQERSRRLAGEAETLRTQLMEAQQSAKQSRNEAERMRDRLRAVQDELHLATTSDDNRSQEEISLILQRCNDLEEINSRLKVDLQLLEEANLNLRTDLAVQLNQLGTEYETSSELTECRLQRDKIGRELSSLQEEMVFMKQCYSQCSDMNTQLSQEMVTLQEEYTNIIQSSAYGMYRYLLPLLVGFIAVCFGLQMYIFK